MSLEIHTAELRGFLNAVQQLCGLGHSFSVEAIPAGANEESTLSRYFAMFEGGFKYLGSTAISYEKAQALLHQYIFINLSSVRPQLQKELNWQLIEYYGLASTAVGGSFNPLVSEGALLLSIAQNHYKQCTYFVVRVPGYVMTQ